MTERDGEDCERASKKNRRYDIGAARPVTIACDLVAEKCRDRHVMGAPERPNGESGRDEESIDKGERKVARMQRRRERQGQSRAERPGNEKRQSRADE